MSGPAKPWSGPPVPLRTVSARVLLAPEDLAAMVVCGRESVGAAMRELREQGLIDVQGGFVTVLAPRSYERSRSGRRLRHRGPPGAGRPWLNRILTECLRVPTGR